jgi:hypothetical protein
MYKYKPTTANKTTASTIVAIRRLLRHLPLLSLLFVCISLIKLETFSLFNLNEEHGISFHNFVEDNTITLIIAHPFSKREEKEESNKK